MIAKLLVFVAMASNTAWAAASPAEEAIRRNVQNLISAAEIQDVVYAPRLGLYEVITPRGLFYTDKNGSYLIFGATVVDTKTKKNLTEQRMEALSGFDFSKLPLADAVKIVHGDGSRAVVTFEDPNCPYCKKLTQELVKASNVTVYTFLTPILSADSAEKSKAIWCAADQQAAWMGFMVNSTPPPEQKDCATPIERNLALMKKFRITGTPAIFFTDNSKSGGFLSAEQIQKKLSEKK